MNMAYFISSITASEHSVNGDLCNLRLTAEMKLTSAQNDFTLQGPK
jgi:hypothetical protein